MVPSVSHPRAPMFTMAVALAAGILLANFCWRPPLWVAIAGIVFSVAAALVISRNARLAWCVAHLPLLALGWLAFVGQAETSAAELHGANLGDFLNGHAVTLVAQPRGGELV